MAEEPPNAEDPTRPPEAMLEAARAIERAMAREVLRAQEPEPGPDATS